MRHILRRMRWVPRDAGWEPAHLTKTRTSSRSPSTSDLCSSVSNHIVVVLTDYSVFRYLLPTQPELRNLGVPIVFFEVIFGR